MQRPAIFRTVVGVVVLLLLGVSFLSFHFIAQARQDQRMALNGQLVPLVNRAHLLGAANGQQALNLSIGLQLRNQAELDNLLSNLNFVQIGARNMKPG